MASLTSKERKALSDEVFGLPKDRKYPLTDEAHVRKAIQYFKFCAPGKRNELSKNINARAKELNMELEISKDSTFYKYADKNIVKESAYDAFEYRRLVEIGGDEITNIINGIQKEIRVTVAQSLEKLLNEPTLAHFLKVEDELLKKISYPAFQKVYNTTGTEHLINPITHVNKAMSKAYDLLFGFMKYNQPELNFSTHYLITGIFEDIFFYMDDVIQNCGCTTSECSCSGKLTHKIELLKEITAHYHCNIRYVVRKLQELSVAAFIQTRMLVKEPDSPEHKEIERNLLKMRMILTDAGNYMIRQCKKDFDPTIENRQMVFDTLKSVGTMNVINSTNYLNVLKHELQSEVKFVSLDRSMAVRSETYQQLRFFNDVVDRNHSEIFDILTLLENEINKCNVGFYNKNYSICLDSKDLIVFSELDKFQRMYTGKDINGDNVYYGVCSDKLYLLGKTNVPGQYVLIKLYEKGKTYLKPENLIFSIDLFDKNDKMSAIKITIGRINDTRCVTEGISFDGKGGFKFSFKPKKSFMDEYSENHKILIQNFKSKNYLGMKTNLAFLFELINTTERLLYSKKGINPDVKRDAEKARMFAINDFKTYLKEVQKVEPDFNFTEYYEKSDYGKIIVGIKKEDIVGMKRLFQTIILS